MLVIPIRSELHKILKSLAQTRRMVFVTGLPGVGKSLLIQQLALIASAEGRVPHLLQYTIAREPFETSANLRLYPEVDGVTDPAIRKAVGEWAREAVVAWDAKHADPSAMLIGEVPLIGNRFIELVELREDSAESLLAGESAEFIVPVPSWEVREVIERRRAATIADPSHEREKLDAPPNVLNALWQEVNAVARQMGLTKARPDSAYNPYIYGGVYDALLRHRNARLLLIEQVLKPEQSVYESDMMASHLQATTKQVAAHIERVEQAFTPGSLKKAVENWHTLATETPKQLERGPELRLPLPQSLHAAASEATLSEAQQKALHALIALPFDASIEATMPVLDDAIASLSSAELAPTAAGVKKFDIFDSYFNVTRVEGDAGALFLQGLLSAYRNVLDNLRQPPQALTVVEQPMLRMALETTLRQFI